MRGRMVMVCTLLAAAVAGPVAAQDAQKLLENYGTVVTVYGQRIPVEEKQILNTTAGVTVITREAIQKMGATTIQQVLENLPGVVLHNITGNPVESSVDLRGFPDGTSMAVFLDGVRLNDIQDNSVRWDLIPIEDVERIEIYPGASGPLYGGGALAGVVNIVTRRDPGIPRLDLKGEAGSFGAREARTHASGSFGPWEFYATATQRHAKGWRENDGYRLDDGLVRLSYTPDSSNQLALLVKYSGGAISDPGSLTAQEMAQNPRQDPYNRYDGTRGREYLASLRYAFTPASGWTFSAQAYGRKQERDTLTTGRYGSGFLGSDQEDLQGLLADASRTWKRGPWSFAVSGGADLSSGTVNADGFYTDIYGQNKRPASRNDLSQHNSGAYLQGDLGWGSLHLVVGARSDRSAYGYSDLFSARNDRERVFRESTWRSGLLWHTGTWSSLFLTYSEGYRIPSVVELFAYPGFYSNPGLRSTRAGDWEGGWRYLKEGWRFSVTGFRMHMTDEVVYVLTHPKLFIGENMNVGRSTRKGVEAEAHLPLPAGFAFHLTGCYQESEVTAGPYAGHRLPMVPRGSGSAGFSWSNPDLSVELYGHWVGPQPLDNDLLNQRPDLPGYSTLDLSVRYAFRAVTVQGTVTNLLDRRFANRGITNGATDYFTPAYPQAVRFSFMWSF